jgi:ribosome-binding protein aMBF1 (putative translation factor)
MAKTTDALELLDRMIGDDAEMRHMIAEERVNAQVAQMIYEARTEASLTQKALAVLIGSKQPVIARLEDADYDGHSISMLQRIAAALGKRLDIRLLPGAEPRRSA